MTADELYRRAEAALAARDPVAADRLLAMLVAEHRSSSLLDEALYERARIAYQQRAWAAARRHLDGLAALDSTPLAEPGHYLRCRIAVVTRDAAAHTCFRAYRTQFRGAAHDFEALAFLAQHAHATGGCSAATAFVDELASTYPHHAVTATWQTRCTRRSR